MIYAADESISSRHKTSASTAPPIFVERGFLGLGVLGGFAGAEFIVSPQ